MPTHEFSIRPAVEADAGAILNCLHCAFAPYRGEYTAEGFLDTVLTADTILQRMASMHMLVAVTTGGDVIGTIGSVVKDVGSGHLRGMAVLPEWHGKGVAEQLLEAAERDLRASGCSRVTLNTTAPLQRAVRFYQRHGYRLSGQVTNFFGMPLYQHVKELA